MAERLVDTGQVSLACESFGSSAAPTVLLIMGNSAPGLVWPTAFCTGLADAGYHVLRFDQRDTGLSTYVDFDAAPYTLDDLVADAFGVLDGFGIERAHVVGLSQGGVLAYRMAIRAPDRVATVATLMSSADLRPKTDAFLGLPRRVGELSRPAPDYVAAVIALNAEPPIGLTETAARFVDNFRLASGPKAPFDEIAWAAIGRAFAERPTLRGDGLTAAVANNSHHARAQAATSDLTSADLAVIACPVLIVHGTCDPIFPPDHARWAAERIAHAELLLVEDMGHALDPAYFTPIAKALERHWAAANPTL